MLQLHYLKTGFTIVNTVLRGAEESVEQQLIDDAPRLATIKTITDVQGVGEIISNCNIFLHINGLGKELHDSSTYFIWRIMSAFKRFWKNQKYSSYGEKEKKGVLLT